MRLLAAAAALCALLSACTVQVEESPKDKPTASQTATQSVPVDKEQQFVDVVRANVGFHGTDAELAMFGNNLCAITSESSVDQVFSEVLFPLLETEQDAYDVGFVYGAAIKLLCPEHSAEMQAFIDKNGGAGV